MEKEKIEFKKRQNCAEITACLEGLIKGFKEGKVVVENGEECLLLNPAGLIAVEVKAKRKKDKEKLSLELSWHAVGETCAAPEPVLDAGAVPPVGESKVEEKSVAQTKGGEAKDQPEKTGKNPASEAGPAAPPKK